MRDAGGKVDGDGAWAAADVEDAERGVGEVCQKVRARVLNCTPAVRAEDRGVVAVDVRSGHCSSGGRGYLVPYYGRS